MRTLAALGVLAAATLGGDRVDEIRWLSSKAAIEKAKDKKTARWLLVYKEWPR